DGRAIAIHEVEHPFRHACFLQDLRKDVRAERSDLARLQYHRASRGERRCNLAADLIDRPIPRRNETADADGLASNERRTDPLLELELFEHCERRRQMLESARRLRIAREL